MEKETKGDRSTLAPSTVNRLMSDLRAALNAAAERHRRELPAHILAEVKIGTRALPLAAATARKQILAPAQIQNIIGAAFSVDDSGDFGRLVLVAAATGARYSQITAIRVGDVQAAQGRILVPGSRKGRSPRAKPPAAVPVSQDVIEKLKPALDGRPADAPLLSRWAYRNIGPFKWERDHRRPWGPAYEIEKHWAACVAAAEVPPETVMYALRHSSIVRGLTVGIPVRLVAALHDTSIEMIEAHYSAHITEATDEIARRAVLSWPAA
ncbi:tyrosine-type recombinase/integrase [Ancylobacter sp. VNQ12]|uniref:tyrosine-type recombinase/integrase n=1 Tax=Ancylobacter sp. VNQ12 TaxID=3400920 RepID=UPI003C01FF5C